MGENKMKLSIAIKRDIVSLRKTHREAGEKSWYVTEAQFKTFVEGLIKKHRVNDTYNFIRTLEMIITQEVYYGIGVRVDS